MVRPINLKFSAQEAPSRLTSSAFVPAVDGVAPNLVNYRVPVIDLVPDVDVRRYGPTGTTDDTATLVAALAAASTGGTVVVPAGVTLTVEAVTVSGKEIRGPGTLKYKANASGPFMTLTGSARLVGLQIDGNRSNQTTNQHSIVTSAADGARVVGCDFYEFRARVFVTSVADSPNGLIEGCTFRDIGATGVGCDAVCLRSPSWTVIGSQFRDIDDGHCVRVGLFGSDPTTVPVRGCVISSNQMEDTNHNAVTLELYAQDTVVNANYIARVDQAVKCETDGGTVYNNSITNNIIRDIGLATALNLTADRTTFSGNRCINLPAGPIFAGEAICSGNYFESVGTAASNATITTSGGIGELTCVGNRLINSPYRAIVADGPATIVGNYIENCGDIAIRIAGSGHTVQGNTISGAVTGITLTATATNSVVMGNSLASISGTTIAVSNNVAAFDTNVVAGNAGAASLVVAKTIATGVLPVPLAECQIAVTTEGGAATDDLDVLTPPSGIQVGKVIVLRPNSSSQDPTIRDASTVGVVGGANIHLVGGSGGNFAMLTSAYKIALQWSGTFWQELWRSTT